MAVACEGHGEGPVTSPAFLSSKQYAPSHSFISQHAHKRSYGLIGYHRFSVLNSLLKLSKNVVKQFLDTWSLGFEMRKRQHKDL